MGICGSGLNGDDKAAMEASKRLDKNLQNTSATEQKVIKLLLLGTGESGKSTIFKQMQILYTVEGFTDYEKRTYRHVLRRNVVESMQTLLQGAARFGYKLGKIEADQAAQTILHLDPLSADFWVPQVVECVRALWGDPERGISGDDAIGHAYDNRSKLQLPDSAKYLFDNIERIGAHDYSPTQHDILRARLRTSGIVERIFHIKNVDFKFLDVGGQRNERRKWIHCFEGVTAVIFVAAISEYDQVLYEDEKENRLVESVNVFRSICNNKYFDKTAMILFLNKMDLFVDKIKKGVPLRTAFPEYPGDNSLADTKVYIKDKFENSNTNANKYIFPHFTCATDTDQIEKVFDDCRRVIMKRSLEKLGLA